MRVAGKLAQHVPARRLNVDDVRAEVGEGLRGERTGYQRGQIEHLLELRDVADIFLQVMPFTSPVRMAVDTSFTIMEFPEPVDRDVVCVGYPTGLLWVEDLAEVDQYNALFRHLQVAALSFDDSAALINSVLKDL